MIWSAVQRFGTMIISFIAQLVLARLLTPDDFGCIGILLVFITLASTFIDGGFGSALIQKKNPTDEDYSTVFYWNLALSVILYAVLFFSAPAIAAFYKMHQLITVLRVVGLLLIFNAFALIQTTQMNKQLEFKKLAIINLISTSLGAIVGIAMAVLGYGVWSLVAQILVLNFVTALLLWIWRKWRPLRHFSKQSFKELFNFGGLMLLSNLVDAISDNLVSLIVGRAYSAKDLGFYTQAKKLMNIPVTSLSVIVNSVSFPIFSEFQNDLPRLKSGVKKNIKAVTYLNFPMMALLIVIAHPLFTLLFTSKWDSAVPYFQVLSIAGMLCTLNTCNLSVIKAMGRSGIYLILELVKRAISIGFIVIGFNLGHGIMGMLWMIVLYTFLFFFAHAFVSGKLIHYGIWEQIKDVGIPFVLSIAVAALTAFLTKFVPFHYVIVLCLQILFYAVVYFGISHLLKLDGYVTYYEIIKDKIIQLKNRRNG